MPDGTGDFPTIEAAINVAVDGDTVEMSDGTFTGGGNRNINFQGKVIVVRSQSGKPEDCVIDCRGAGRGFLFINGETAASVLEGLTITGAYVDDHGGGITCRYASSPTILSCVISENHARHAAGIFCAESSCPSIIDCTITDNYTYAYGMPGAGGGISLVTGSCPRIIGCHITNNQAGGVGGGIYCSMCSPTISDCVIAGNRPQGIYCISSSNPTITNCPLFRARSSATTGGNGLAESTARLALPRLWNVASYAAIVRLVGVGKSTWTGTAMSLLPAVQWIHRV
jgi:parallel beta-helix repeat protein